MDHHELATEAVPQTPSVFGKHGPTLRRAGFAVLPAAGKKPLMAGFPKWATAPSIATVEQWAHEHPAADLVYVPGLSRIKRGGPGVITIDGDDGDACGRILELFGDTPGKVRTRRGMHFLYRDHGESLGKLQSLKRYGLNADIKHGPSIVVAPPSRHEKDRTFAYAWESGDETVIRDLPAFNIAALRRLIEAARSPGRNSSEPYKTQSPGREIAPNGTSTAPAAAPPLLPEGSRGLGLNRWLCTQLGTCHSLDALLDLARTYNTGLVESGHAPLDETEIVKRATAVWNDVAAGKLEKLEGCRAIARTDANEVKRLCTFDHGGDAVALLMLLRAEHQARVQRGETFALNVKAMADKETLAWTTGRFRKAIDVLLRAGYIKLVESGHNTKRGRVAQQFTLVPRGLATGI
jgi:bifunctional DNA primase/polymerase-like protein